MKSLSFSLNYTRTFLRVLQGTRTVYSFLLFISLTLLENSLRQDLKELYEMVDFPSDLSCSLTRAMQKISQGHTNKEFFLAVIAQKKKIQKKLEDIPTYSPSPS